MNLTAITATLGKYRSDDIECLIEELPRIKKDEQGYVVYMVFDIKHKKIYFESGEPVKDDTAKPIQVSGATIKIFNRDRTICDVLRYENKLEKEVFNNTVQRYVKDQKKNIRKLFEYAELFNINN